MERGVGTPAATIREKEDVIVVQGPIVAEPVGYGDEASGSTRAASTAVSDVGEGGENENSVISTEWREGPHQVIERKAGPSGEVRCSFVRRCFF